MAGDSLVILPPLKACFEDGRVVLTRKFVEGAERLAGAAGSPQSESWVSAQEALSVAIAAAGPTRIALSDIDAIGVKALQTQGGIAPKDLAAIKSAGAQVGALDQRQADRINAIQRRLGL